MNKKQKKTLYRIIAAVVLVLILKLLPQFPTPVELALYCIPYLVVGWDVLRKALLGIKNRQPFDECFLMAVATVGAFALGDYVEGCAVIIFYQIGELFQSVAVGKSRQSISSLTDIRPDYANIEGEDGKLEQVDPDDVEIGTVIVVQPGERVPIDGVIVFQPAQGTQLTGRVVRGIVGAKQQNVQAGLIDGIFSAQRQAFLRIQMGQLFPEGDPLKCRHDDLQ